MPAILGFLDMLNDFDDGATVKPAILNLAKCKNHRYKDFAEKQLRKRFSSLKGNLNVPWKSNTLFRSYLQVL